MVRYLIEISKSARANCRECKSKIDKGFLRIGKGTDNGEFESVQYYHVGCWRVPRTIKNAEQLEGYDKLSKKEQKEVKKQMEKPKKTTNFKVSYLPGSEGEMYMTMMNRMSSAALKEILKLNRQSQDHVKDGLVAAVVDGMLNGAIPSCPKCVQGRLNLVQDGYKCAGSYDVSAKRFKRCNYTTKSVERTIWRMPSEYRKQIQFI